MNNGFFTALGTPLDHSGNLVEGSFIHHIEDQVEAGASGILIMGSMGNQSSIKNSEYSKVAKVGTEAAKGKCPVFVGVMDNSIARVMDRIDSLKGLNIDGVVATTPFYYAATQSEIKSFFSNIAKLSKYPLYLYDLPSVTKAKINTATVEYLMTVNNIKGIKTGDITTAKALIQSEFKKDDFQVMFSGLDIFDVAYKFGIKMNLDGMFACTSKIATQMYRSLEQGDYDKASTCLNDILLLRNTFIEVGVFEGFSHAMNLLGFEGTFAPDYMELKPENMDKVKACMIKLGLL